MSPPQFGCIERAYVVERMSAFSTDDGRAGVRFETADGRHIDLVFSAHAIEALPTLLAHARLLACQQGRAQH